MAAAVSAGVIFAMPVTGQAMKSSAKVHTSTSADVHFKNKSDSWVMRHCRISNDVKCGHHYVRRHHHGPYYGIYKHRHHKTGVIIKTY
jgi:hypothetical protein